MRADDAIAASVADAKVIARFWRKLDKSGDCWPWIGEKSPEGYGQMTTPYGNIRAHRLSWTIANGKIPDGLLVCHTCDNPPCVNPAHLWLGTNLDNRADMVAKGRQVRGEQNGFSKLTDAKVREIRALLPFENNAKIAARFQISDSQIRRIRHGWIWKHVT